MDNGPYVYYSHYRETYCARIWSPDIGDFKLHIHGNYFEIAFLLSGEIKHILNGTTSILSKGDICLLAPASSHQYISLGNPAKFMNLTFSTNLVSHELWENVDVTKMPMIVHLDNCAFSSVLDNLNTISGLSDNGDLKPSKYLKTLIEWLIFKIFANSGDFCTEPSAIRPAIIYVQSNFFNPITAEEVANLIHFSPSYFSMLFKREMGITFKSYLLNLRLEYAAELLAMPDCTISEARERSGFRTPEYFSRAFKKKFMLPPEDFRKSRVTSLA